MRVCCQPRQRAWQGKKKKRNIVTSGVETVDRERERARKRERERERERESMCVCGVSETRRQEEREPGRMPVSERDGHKPK